MARVPYLTRDDAKTPEEEAVWQRLETERPLPTGYIFRALAQVPSVLDASLDYGASLRNDTEVDGKLRELAILTVAIAANVEYAIAHHSGPAVLHGVTEEQLAEMRNFESSDAFDAAERAVMRLAHESTVNVQISDEVWNDARSHLSEKEMVELVLNIGYYNNGVRLMAMLDVDLEEPYVADPVGAFLRDIGQAS